MRKIKMLLAVAILSVVFFSCEADCMSCYDVSTYDYETGKYSRYEVCEEIPCE